ncbi:hypothetical protein BD410DRAFT_807215 [Rickenella mellea]|uniref:Uncharacterized protein n=1 Tax=Rickenella mellea TaxID=50990 RepID=A0A4Y7PRF3_9AGAM|nr:hypothetical protein BD410DRAFT_807215 [Rickenella mellea]
MGSSTSSESATCKSTNWQDQFQAVSVSQSSVAHEGIKIETANEFSGIKTLKNTLDLAGQLLACDDATMSSPIDADRNQYVCTIVQLCPRSTYFNLRLQKRLGDGDLEDRPPKRRALFPRAPVDLVVTEIKRKGDDQPGMANATLIDTTQSLKRKSSDELDDRPGKRRKETLLSLPDEILLMVAEHFEGKTRRKDLRTLTSLNRLCANLFAGHYMHEVGFKIDRGALTLKTDVEVPDICETSDTLPKTDPYLALLIWRRSHLYTELQTLTCLFSPSLDLATLESQFLLSFLKSLPAPSTQPYVHHFTLKSLGTEQVMLHRILENVHRMNSSQMCLSSSTDAPYHDNQFMRAVKAGGDMPHLTRFEVEGDVMTSPRLLSWTTKICSSTALRKLCFGDNLFTHSDMKRILAVTLPSLQEITVDATIHMVDLEDFLRRHRQIQRIDVVSSPHPSTPKMHVSWLKGSISLPELEELGGPAPFLLAMFEHLHPLPKDLHSITIRPDGGSLGATAVGRVLGRLPRDVFRLSVYFAEALDAIYFSSKAGRRVRPERKLLNLTSLMFKRRTVERGSLQFYKSLEKEQQDNIIDWLKLFPSLTTVIAIGIISNLHLFLITMYYSIPNDPLKWTLDSWKPPHSVLIIPLLKLFSRFKAFKLITQESSREFLPTFLKENASSIKGQCAKTPSMAPENIDSALEFYLRVSFLFLQQSEVRRFVLDAWLRLPGLDMNVFTHNNRGVLYRP